jgi:hypothetical protein
MKAVIRLLPHNTTAEDISNGLVSLGFEAISVRQMTATDQSLSDGSKTITPPLPNNLAEDYKIPGNFPTAKPLPHHNQGGDI